MGLTVVESASELPDNCEQIPLQGWGKPVYWRPLLVAPTGACLALTITLWVAGLVQEHMDAGGSARGSTAGMLPLAGWLAVYTAGIIVARMSERGTDPAYELLWACNMAMLLAAAGIVLDLPVAISGAVLAVSIDQLCWYVDTVGFLVKGRWGWPVGVSGYLNDPEQRTWVRFATTWHHLWFMPAGMWALSGGIGGFTWHAAIVSSVMTGVLLVFCRATTTRWFALQRADGSFAVIYKNLNLSHGFWRDVKIPCMHRFNDAPAAVLLPWIFITGNLGFHLPPFLLLLAASHFLLQ